MCVYVVHNKKQISESGCRWGGHYIGAVFAGNYLFTCLLNFNVLMSTLTIGTAFTEMKTTPENNCLNKYDKACEKNKLLWKNVT